MRSDLENQSAGPVRYLANNDATIVMMRARFHPFEGEILPTHYTKIGLNIGRTSRLYRKSDAGLLDTSWRRNGFSINLPNDAGVGSSGATTMIGLAVDFAAIGRPHAPSALEPLTSNSLVDTVAARLMRDMFTGAELHGTSNAFFDHSLDALLRRLSHDLAHRPDGEVSPLDEKRLQLAQDFIEANLDNGVSVPEMATLVDMSSTRFAKSFKAATGHAPFQYLTVRRMIRAKQMLTRGKSVTETAFTVGYANPSKFSAAFKKIFGATPSAFANSQLGK